MRTRLQRYGVSRAKFEVATIAGWALKYASSYPSLSGLATMLPSGTEWNEVYTASVEILARKAIREVVKRSFSGVYVDEYQDCNLIQHAIVMAIADLLPCRLLGDPLQAIFDFYEPTIDWQRDVVPNFERLPDLGTPYRWQDVNPKLGQWLGQVRSNLIEGEDVDLASAPVHWIDNSVQNQIGVCFSAAKSKASSVVAMKKWPKECHELASKLNGLYGSMEELDCRSLMDFARQIDNAKTGTEKAAHFIPFAAQCFTTVGSELSGFLRHYREGRVPSTAKLTKNLLVIEALNRLAMRSDVRSLVEAARAIDRYPGAILYRRELWQEMKSTTLTFLNGTHESLEETAWYVRDRARRNGRRPDLHVVSRTLLIKGLEFDHAIVMDAHKLNGKEFYVAVSRGRESVTVLSPDPVLSFKTISNILEDYA